MDKNYGSLQAKEPYSIVRYCLLRFCNRFIWRRRLRSKIVRWKQDRVCNGSIICKELWSLRWTYWCLPRCSQWWWNIIKERPRRLMLNRQSNLVNEPSSWRVFGIDYWKRSRTKEIVLARCLNNVWKNHKDEKDVIWWTYENWYTRRLVSYHQLHWYVYIHWTNSSLSRTHEEQVFSLPCHIGW